MVALQKQRQEDLHEFKVSLGYRASSRTARATQRNHLQKTKRREREREHKIPTLGKSKVQALVTRLCRP